MGGGGLCPHFNFALNFQPRTLMPIYAYRCELCGHQHDALQKLADPHLTRCPACGQDGLKRQLTAAGFQLKGGGWYVTDFRDGGKKDGKPAADAAKAAASGSGGDSAAGGSAATPAAPSPAPAPAPAAPAPSGSSASGSTP